MGLDIRAYKGLQVVKEPQFDEYGDLVNWNTEWTPGPSMDWSETHFPGRGAGVNSNTVYRFEDSFGFCAGSYFGYNWWRDQLNELSDGKSFRELINFADNEGVIGPVVSKKLYQDFQNNKGKASVFSRTFNNGDRWLDKYNDWMRAFEFAAENGAVDFH